MAIPPINANAENKAAVRWAAGTACAGIGLAWAAVLGIPTLAAAAGTSIVFCAARVSTNPAVRKCLTSMFKGNVTKT